MPKPATYQPIAILEAEQSVLGAILVRPEVMDQVDSTIQPDDFYRKAHSNIFQAILDLYTQDGIALSLMVYTHLGACQCTVRPLAG